MLWVKALKLLTAWLERLDASLIDIYRCVGLALLRPG
jgi:hypothetical protein